VGQNGTEEAPETHLPAWLFSRSSLMSFGKPAGQPKSWLTRLCVAAVLGVLATYSVAWAGHTGFGRFGAVGGVAISVDGVLSEPDATSVKLTREMYTKELAKISPELNKPVELRKISLRAIEQAIANMAQDDIAYHLPDEIKYMAGIQRLQYIFIYPEQNDIVFAGPGEGWKVDEKANVVGITTGRPVLRVEDLMLALRTSENARQGGITCSIDPTAEGRQRFEAFMAKQTTYNSAVLDGIEKALGPQQISITGVPDDSRFARMLVASDYKMKRIAMKLEQSPVKGLPSFVDMMKSSNAELTNMMPRWWMECNYEPCAKSEDGLAWEIRGPGVKVMTEDELVSAEGNVSGTGKANPVAQKWADTMTAKYDELSVKEPVFGELRNLMDLCVVAALISRENMLSKANLELPNLLQEEGKLKLTKWHSPKTVSTQCSALKRGKEYIITASGGVAITSWEVASKSEVKPEVAKTRESAKPAEGSSLWWN
jgi:hypothetical protein